MTVAGLSRFNIANALAAAAACDALGLSAARITSGLRSFAQDSAANPGRLNLFERDGIFVVIDFAHNEAGLAGLMDVSRAVAGRRKVRLAIGTAGDRTDEILTGLGVIAGGADDLVIAEKRHYLRGRTLENMNELMRAGARQGGYRGEIDAHETEAEALAALLGRAGRGDVCAVMTHVERNELFAWLEAEGFRPVGPDRLREVLGAAGIDYRSRSTSSSAPMTPTTARSPSVSLEAPCSRRWSSFQTWLAWSTHTTTTSPSRATSRAWRVASSSSRMIVTVSNAGLVALSGCPAR